MFFTHSSLCTNILGIISFHSVLKGKSTAQWMLFSFIGSQLILHPDRSNVIPPMEDIWRSTPIFKAAEPMKVGSYMWSATQYLSSFLQSLRDVCGRIHTLQQIDRKRNRPSHLKPSSLLNIFQPFVKNIHFTFVTTWENILQKLRFNLQLLLFFQLV